MKGFKRDLSCRTCPRRDSGAFRGLSGKDLACLDRSKASNAYARGQIVFYEDNPAVGAYCVYSGRVRMYKHGEQGRLQVVRVLEPGGLFGHQASIAGLPYPGTTEVMEDSVLCFIEKAVLLGLLERSHALTLEIARRLIRELLKAEQRINDLVQKSPEAKMAQLLLELGNGRRTPALKTACEMEIPRQMMAEMTGMAPETCIRILTRFKKRGFISSQRQKVVLLNPKALQDLSCEAD